MTLEQAKAELKGRGMLLMHRRLYGPDASTMTMFRTEDWAVIDVGPGAYARPIDTEGATYYATWQEAYAAATGRSPF